MLYANSTLELSCRMVPSRVILVLRRLDISEGDFVFIFSYLFSISSFLKSIYSF